MCATFRRVAIQVNKCGSYSQVKLLIKSNYWCIFYVYLCVHVSAFVRWCTFIHTFMNDVWCHTAENINTTTTITTILLLLLLYYSYYYYYYYYSGVLQPLSSNCYEYCKYFTCPYIHLILIQIQWLIIIITILYTVHNTWPVL